MKRNACHESEKGTVFHPWKATSHNPIVNNVVQVISSFASRLIFTSGNDMVTKNGG